MALRVLALALAALVPFFQSRIDATLGAYRAQEEVLYVTSGRDVRRLAPGFDGLAADLYWLRTVQYFGGQRLYAREKRFELLRPLIEITTDLDPRLVIAYKYGATFLSEPKPIGAGRPLEGIAILEKGVAAMILFVEAPDLVHDAGPVVRRGTGHATGRTSNRRRRNGRRRSAPSLRPGGSRPGSGRPARPIPGAAGSPRAPRERPPCTR